MIDGITAKVPSDVFLIDTAFGQLGEGRGGVLFEVCVRNLQGKTLINTLIDYGGSIGDLFASNTLNLSRVDGTVQRLYGIARDDPNVDTTRTTGTTLLQLAKDLRRIGITSVSTIVEWSKNHVDFHIMQRG